MGQEQENYSGWGEKSKSSSIREGCGKSKWKFKQTSDSNGGLPPRLVMGHVGLPKVQRYGSLSLASRRPE